MKVVFINTTGGAGSTVGEFIDTLADGLRDKGFSVLTAVGRGQGDFILGDSFSYRLNALRARIFDSDGFLDRWATQRLCHWLESVKPDIVHLHNLHGYYLDIRPLFDCLARLGSRVIITLHDNWLLTGHCAKIPADCPNFSYQCDRCRFPQRYPATLRTRSTKVKRNLKSTLLHRLPDVTLVCPTAHLARIVQSTDLDDLPVVVIPNGIPDCFFAQRKLRKAGDWNGLRLLASARRWLDEKNLDALRRLAELMPKDWCLTVIGKTPRKESWTNTSFLGLVSNQETLADLYASHDVFLCPSDNETFGLVVAESLACGTPVVVNSRAATAELVTPTDGLTDTFDDIPSLIETIRSAASLSPVSEYRLDSMVQAYADLYRH